MTAVTEDQYTVEATLRAWLGASGVCPATLIQIACENVGLEHPQLEDHCWAEDEAIRVYASELIRHTPDGADPLAAVNDLNVTKLAVVSITRWATEVSAIVSEDELAEELSALDKPDLSVADIL